MSNELKHCPFCRRLLSGIQPALGLVQVVCEICEAAGPTAETDDEAVSAWNSADPALVSALQKALAYWMPKVFDDRSAHDAYLLVGYEGEPEARCWGDEMVAAAPRWTSASESLPTEPGWYLAILKPDNDWGLMSDTALQVEFDAYTTKPKAFTCFYDYHGDEDITEAVTHWMPMPAIDASRNAEIERGDES